MCSGSSTEKNIKAAIFCLNIPMSKSTNHPQGCREISNKLAIFYPLITPVFTVSCFIVVVLLCWLHLSHISCRDHKTEVILCFNSLGPNLKTLYVSLHTVLSYCKESCFHIFSFTSLCLPFLLRTYAES